jgi:hypothetical protein
LYTKYIPLNQVYPKRARSIFSVSAKKYGLAKGAWAWYNKKDEKKQYTEEHA